MEIEEKNTKTTQKLEAHRVANHAGLLGFRLVKGVDVGVAADGLGL